LTCPAGDNFTTGVTNWVQCRVDAVIEDSVGGQARWHAVCY